LLTASDSVENYGYAADKLVLMILREVEEYHNEKPAESPQDTQALFEDGPISQTSDGFSDTVEDLQGIDHWEDAFENSNAAADDENFQEEEEEEWMESNTDQGVAKDKHPYHISMSAALISAGQELLECLKDESTSERVVLEKYITLVFKVFASSTLDAATQRFFTPLETFFICMALTPDGSFKTAYQNSPVFSKVQYLCLFSFLNGALSIPDAAVGNNSLEYVLF